MNKSDVASRVIDKQLHRMAEQERARLTLLPSPEFDKVMLSTGLDGEQILDLIAQAEVLMKISMTSGWN